MEQGYEYDIKQHGLLLDKVDKTLTGRTEFDDLLKLVADRESQIQRLRSDFNSVLAGETEVVREFCRGSVNDVNKFFDEYLSILSGITASGVNFDREALEGVSERLKGVYDNLNAAFLYFRNEALIARGPTTHPGINLLLNTIESILHNNDAYRELWDNLQFEIASAERIFEVYKDAEPDYFSGNLKTFYTDYLELLRDFEGEADPKYQPRTASDKEEYKQVLKDFRDSLEEIGDDYRHFDLNYIVTANSFEPTSIPQVNLLINIGNKYIKGEEDREVFEYFLEELRDLFNSMKFRYDGILMGMAPKEGREEEETEILEEILDDIEDSISGFDQFLQTGEVAMFEESVEILQAASDDFAESARMFQEMADEEDFVTCFKCGKSNPSGKTICSNCGTLLPQLKKEAEQSIDLTVGEEIKQVTTPDGEMPVYIGKLFAFADGVIAGVVSADEFGEVLADMEDRLKNAYKSAKEVPPLNDRIIKQSGKEKAEKQQKVLLEASNTYKQGLDTFKTGLDLFNEFAATLSPEILSEAKETSWYGVEKIAYAGKIIEDEFKE